MKHRLVIEESSEHAHHIYIDVERYVNADVTSGDLARVEEVVEILLKTIPERVRNRFIERNAQLEKEGF